MTKKHVPHIVLVMRKHGNLKVLSHALVRHGYGVAGATTIAELTAALTERTPDGALVDVTGFSADVWSMCQTLHETHVPFVVISEPKQRSAASQGLQAGAATVMEKPLVKSSLLKLLEGLTRP